MPGGPKPSRSTRVINAFSPRRTGPLGGPERAMSAIIPEGAERRGPPSAALIL
jgi:hypothetical protein